MVRPRPAPHACGSRRTGRRPARLCALPAAAPSCCSSDLPPRTRRAGRILEAQCALLAIVNKSAYTIYDFGAPAESPVDSSQVFTGNLPSIKKSAATILAASPKKGPTMHDTPPKPAS